MILLHTWALFAGLAIGLPLVIHWLTRPRPMRLPLSTIRFVREAIQQRRARHRLRDIILLFLRAAAVALLAIAFARPLIGAKPLVPAEASPGGARVIILDQSLGMGEVSHGATAFNRARPIAAKYLALSSGARANLILAAARPRAVVERLTSNFGALRDELSAAQPLAQRLDSAAAINLAAELLASGAPGQRRELIVVSNFQRSNWANVDFSPLPKETQIQLESVAPPQTPDNLAILKVVPQARVEQGREARLDIEVGNYSPLPREVEVIVAAGRVTARFKGNCSAGAKTTLTGTIVPPDAGWQGGEARLVAVEDGLAADNARPFVLDVRPSPTYILITRESSAPAPISSHFLERALAPQTPRDPAAASKVTRVKRIAPDSLDRDVLAGAELLVLDHPGKLSTPQIGLLAALVRHGRPMFYVAAEPVDATNLALFAQAAGADLKMPVEFSPPPAGAARRNLFLADVKRNAAPFRTFGESLNAAIGPLRFGGGLASHPLAGGLPEEVLAEYGDHSACLVVTACAAGTLAILNADLNESNIVGSAVFVPLVDELVDKLLGRRMSDGSVACGESLSAYLPADAGAAAGLKTAGPGGSAGSSGTISEDANFVMWRWNGNGAPGVYSVKRDAATVFAVAAAAPGQASDLTPLDLSLLKDRLAGDRSVSIQSASDEGERRDNLWAWVLVVCAGCMLMELLMLRMFRT
jgi:hypothetical protein